jgi:hypothetical protein
VKNIQVDRDRILETQIQSELLANRNVSAIFIGREAVLSYDYFVCSAHFGKQGISTFDE